MTVHRPQPDAPLFIRPTDPSVRAQDVDALTGQNAAVLARLTEGPATKNELTAAGGGDRIAARVNDINAHFARAGDGREVVGQWLAGRVYQYRVTGGAA